METSELSMDMKSILLYMETCMVDQDGRLEGVRMNSDDFDAMTELKEKGIIDYGRLPFKAIEAMKSYGKMYTRWAKFSEEAWSLAHRLRKERSVRTIEKMLKQYDLDENYSFQD